MWVGLVHVCIFFFFKQKTAYEMRISDWSSDVCSSDLLLFPVLLLLRRRGTDCMMGDIEGFEAPMHRALAEPILPGGAPRAIAIVNGPVAAALGLGLQHWVAGIVLWGVGHRLPVLSGKRLPAFAPVFGRDHV